MFCSARKQDFIRTAESYPNHKSAGRSSHSRWFSTCVPGHGWPKTSWRLVPNTALPYLMVRQPSSHWIGKGCTTALQVLEDHNRIRSFIKMFWPRPEPCGFQLDTSLQTDVESFISTHWEQLFKSITIQPTIYHFIHKVIMGHRQQLCWHLGTRCPWHSASLAGCSMLFFPPLHPIPLFSYRFIWTYRFICGLSNCLACLSILHQSAWFMVLRAHGYKTAHLF